MIQQIHPSHIFSKTLPKKSIGHIGVRTCRRRRHSKHSIRNNFPFGSHKICPSFQMLHKSDRYLPCSRHIFPYGPAPLLLPKQKTTHRCIIPMQQRKGSNGQNLVIKNNFRITRQRMKAQRIAQPRIHNLQLTLYKLLQTQVSIEMHLPPSALHRKT